MTENPATKLSAALTVEAVAWAKEKISAGNSYQRVAEALCQAILEAIPLTAEVRLPILEGAREYLAKAIRNESKLP